MAAQSEDVAYYVFSLILLGAIAAVIVGLGYLVYLYAPRTGYGFVWVHFVPVQESISCSVDSRLFRGLPVFEQAIVFISTQTPIPVYLPRLGVFEYAFAHETVFYNGEEYSVSNVEFVKSLLTYRGALYMVPFIGGLLGVLVVIRWYLQELRSIFTSPDIPALPPPE